MLYVLYYILSMNFDVIALSDNKLSVDAVSYPCLASKLYFKLLKYKHVLQIKLDKLFYKRF